MSGHENIRITIIIVCLGLRDAPSLVLQAGKVELSVLLPTPEVVLLAAEPKLLRELDLFLQPGLLAPELLDPGLVPAPKLELQI